MEVMSRMKYRSLDIPGGRKIKKWQVYGDALDADVLINVPIAKDHGSTRLSLGMKNLMGLIESRNSFHSRGLDQCIADLSSALRPQLTVVDAVRILMAQRPDRRQPRRRQAHGHGHRQHGSGRGRRLRHDALQPGAEGHRLCPAGRGDGTGRDGPGPGQGGPGAGVTGLTVGAGRSRACTLYKVRRVVQGVAFLFFAALAILAATVPATARWLLAIDPLTGVASMLASRQVAAVLLLGEPGCAGLHARAWAVVVRVALSAGDGA